MTLSEERFYYDLNSHDIEILILKIQSGNPIFSLEKMLYDLKILLLILI